MNVINMIRERENAPVRNGAMHRYAGANYTRFYNVVIPFANGECRIDTYAVKTRNKRTGDLAIKKVARYRSDKNRYYLRDILFHNFSHQYVVNWCNEPFGHKHQAVCEDVDESIGKWGWCDYSFGRIIDLGGEWLNWFECTKYERCGYAVNAYLHFKEYAEVWNQNHATEFLGKSDLWRIITPNFVSRLTHDRGLFGFFRNHINEIKRPDCRGGFYSAYGIREINYAHKNGLSLDEARNILDFNTEIRSEIRSARIPALVDRDELRAYCRKNDLAVRTYSHYCHMLGRLGIDLDTYGYMFPSRWTKTYDKVSEDFDKLLEKEREVARKKAKREEAKRRREEKERLAHWKLVCGYLEEINGRKFGEFTIIVPKTNDQLKAEGNAMHNCIGCYGNRLDRGETLLLFFQKDGNPFMDVELDPKRFSIVQARYVDNKDATRKHKALVREIANEIKSNYRKVA